MWIFTCECVSTQGGISFSLAGVTCCCELPHTELGTKLKSFVRAANATNCWAISPRSCFQIKLKPEVSNRLTQQRTSLENTWLPRLWSAPSLAANENIPRYNLSVCRSLGAIVAPPPWCIWSTPCLEAASDSSQCCLEKTLNCGPPIGGVCHVFTWSSLRGWLPFHNEADLEVSMLLNHQTASVLAIQFEIFFSLKLATYFESWSVWFDFWKVTHSPYTSVSWTRKRAAQQGLLWRVNSRAEGKQLGGALPWVHVHCWGCFLACRNEAFQKTTPASTFFLPNAMCFFSLYSVPSLWTENVDLLSSYKTSVS